MRKFVLLACAAMMLPVCGPTAAQPKTADVEHVVRRHMAAYDKQDIEALMADYGDDVVAVMSGQVFHGKAALRALFAQYFTGTAQKFDAKLDRVEGDTGVTLWVANPGAANAIQGNDVFVVRDGKIRFQATTGVKPVALAKP